MNCSIHLDGKKQCTYVEDDNLIKVGVIFAISNLKITLILRTILSRMILICLQKLIALLERKDKKEEDEDSKETKQVLKDLQVDVK